MHPKGLFVKGLVHLVPSVILLGNCGVFTMLGLVWESRVFGGHALTGDIGPQCSLSFPPPFPPLPSLSLSLSPFPLPLFLPLPGPSLSSSASAWYFLPWCPTDPEAMVRSIHEQTPVRPPVKTNLSYYKFISRISSCQGQANYHTSQGEDLCSGILFVFVFFVLWGWNPGPHVC